MILFLFLIPLNFKSYDCLTRFRLRIYKNILIYIFYQTLNDFPRTNMFTIKARQKLD